jgi:hypothetical protein
VRRPPLACRHLGAIGLAIAVAGACSGVEELGPTPQSIGVEVTPPARLAQIRVAILPPADFTSDEPALDVSAVFATYRGFDEASARARLDLRPLPHQRLKPGRCVTAEQLLAADESTARPAGPEAGAKDSQGPREMTLLDAGNITVRLGEAAVDVPLALLPDLVPTMSGVSYAHVSEFLPAGAWPSAEPTPDELEIRVDGEGEELPGFQLRSRLPEPVALSGAADPDGALRLDWRPDGRGEPVALRMLAMIGGEPIGEEVVCLVDDDGSYIGELDELRALGLEVDAGRSLRISATRAARTVFDAGEFTGVEAIVEVRTYLVLGT